MNVTEIEERLHDCEEHDLLPICAHLQGRFPESGRMMARLLAGATVTPEPAHRCLPVGEFLTAVGTPPPMRIEGLLPDRSLFLLAGKPKAGKSFLALDVADCVCQGLPVFGKFAVNRPGAVVTIGMEDGDFEIANRLLKRGIRQTDTRPLHLMTERFILCRPEAMEELRQKVEALNPALVVVDTAAEALGIKDWLNRSEITEKVAPLREFARSVCSVLLVAHNRKADGESGDEIAGSNALTASVDGWLSATRANALSNGNWRRFLRGEGRGGEIISFRGLIPA